MLAWRPSSTTACTTGQAHRLSTTAMYSMPTRVRPAHHTTCARLCRCAPPAPVRLCRACFGALAGAAAGGMSMTVSRPCATPAPVSFWHACSTARAAPCEGHRLKGSSACHLPTCTLELVVMHFHTGL